jgi:hypothetical protein
MGGGGPVSCGSGKGHSASCCEIRDGILGSVYAGKVYNIPGTLSRMGSRTIYDIRQNKTRKISQVCSLDRRGI